MKQLINENKDNLVSRHIFIQSIRNLFLQRGYIEVDTPIISKYSASEPFNEPIKTYPFFNNKPTYLVSSPEYFMKRLLIKTPIPIFQIAHAFRRGEIGDQHSFEFLILEWYNPELNYQQILTEAINLILQILGLTKFDKSTFRQIFIDILQIDPFNTNSKKIIEFIKNSNSEKAPIEDVIKMSKEDQINYLQAFYLQPRLGNNTPIVIEDYPITSGVLAKPNSNSNTAKRFECFYKGVEICNGYEELTSMQEHEDNIKNVNKIRESKGLETFPIDAQFLKSIKKGLPNISGVALGIDRLLALKKNKKSIKEVMNFNWQE